MTWGFITRAHKVINGLGGAGNAILGLGKDLITAPLGDDGNETDGVLSSMWHRAVNAGGDTVNRGAELLRGTEKAISPATGLFGHDLAVAVGGIMGETEKALVATNETISLAGSRNNNIFSRLRHTFSYYDTQGAFEEPVLGPDGKPVIGPDGQPQTHKVQRAHNIGQSFIQNGLGSTDLDNKAAVDKANNSFAGKFIAPVADAVIYSWADPISILGKAAKAGQVAKELHTGEDVIKAVEENRFAKPAQEMAGKSAKEIADVHFPKLTDDVKVPIASHVAAAADPYKQLVLESYAGYTDSLKALQEVEPDVAGQVKRAMMSNSEHLYPETQAIMDPANNELLTAERDAIIPEAERMGKVESMFNNPMLKEIPTADPYQLQRYARLKSEGTFFGHRSSEIYQNSPLSKIIHIAADPLNEKFIDTGLLSSNETFSRFVNHTQLPHEIQDDLVSRYMSAANPLERTQILAETEEKAVGHIAAKNGMTTAEVDAVLAKAGQNRAGAVDFLRSKGIKTIKDTFSFAVPGEEGVLHDVHVPIPSDPANLYPVVDLKAVRKASSFVGQYKLEHPGIEMPAHALDGLTSLWKTGVILRPGWTLKIVGVDEQLRSVFLMGGKSYSAELSRETIPQIVRNSIDRVENNIRRLPFVDGEHLSKEQRGAYPLPNPNHGVKVPDYLQEHLTGTPGDAEQAFHDANSARGILGDYGPGRVGKRALAEGYGSIEGRATTHPLDANYGQVWEEAANTHIGKNPMDRMLMEGKSTEEITKWLKETPEGQLLASKNKEKLTDIESWINEHDDLIAQLLPTPELRASALKGTAKVGDLESTFPEVAQRPNVHLDITKDISGKERSTLGQVAKKYSEKMYDSLGAVPTTVFTRDPVARSFYKAELSRRIEIADTFAQREGRQVTQAEFENIQASARDYANNKVRYYLDDLNHKTRLSESSRFGLSFLGTLQGGFTNWVRLFADNPTALAKYRIAMSMPERAGLVSDENGNHINVDGTATNAKGDVVQAGKQRYINLPHTPGMPKGFKPRINKKFMNTVGDYPGVSPWVALGVGEILKRAPQLEDELGFLQPFGPKGLVQTLLPSTINNYQDYKSSEGDPARLRVFQSVNATEWTNYYLHKRPDKPTFDEVNKTTNNVMAIKTASGFLLPSGISFTSPYQLHIDTLKQATDLYYADPIVDENGLHSALKDENGVYRTPEDWFIDTYGEEFKAFTLSVTKNNGGIQSTAEGAKSAQVHKDMIAAHPDIAGFITGAEGAGAFNKSVYQAQFNEPVSPGSSVMRRQYLSEKDIFEGPNRQVGWDELNNVSDLIDHEVIKRGLPSLSVKGATDLRIMKKNLVGDPAHPELSDPNSLTAKYPEWAADYLSTDKGKNVRIVQGMRAVSEDPTYEGRPEVQGLKQYFADRDLIVAELSKRKTKSLSETGDNADLYQIWEGMKTDTIRKNLPFASTYHRWLENTDELKGK